jgi:perosamine synthetase
MAGAMPLLMDIEKDNFNMERAIVNPYDRNETRALVVPHTFGVPADLAYIKRNRIKLIEDCSQALGSYVDGQHVGLQGDIGIFSFGPSKMITTGSGGMLVTNDKRLADKAREFIDYDKHVPAFNFAMNDLQAAMGIVQLKKLPEFLRKRNEIAKEYIYICARKNWGVQIDEARLDGNDIKRNWYRFVIVDECVDRLKQHLADNGITAIVPIEHRELLHNMLGLNPANYPNAEYTSTHTLSLPIWPDLLDNGFDHIIKALKGF